MAENMTERFDGTCQCGAVEYSIIGRSINLFVCHCSQCQKQSASAFGMALWISDFRTERLSGELRTWQRATPSGHLLTGEMCVQCGSRIFHRHSANEQVLSIKPGTLNPAMPLTPVGHIWTSKAQDWVHIPPEVLSYNENPPDFNAMFQAWQRALKRANRG